VRVWCRLIHDINQSGHPGGPGKNGVSPDDTADMKGRGKKTRKHSEAIEEIAHSYLVSIVAKELWEVKNFLRMQPGRGGI